MIKLHSSAHHSITFGGSPYLRLLLPILCSLLLLVACGDHRPDTPPSSPVCEAGRSVSCACPKKKEGFQVCADDGSKWEPCHCPAPGDDDDDEDDDDDHHGSNHNNDKPHNNPKPTPGTKPPLGPEPPTGPNTCIVGVTDATQRETYRAIYEHYCGSCHGTETKGPFKYEILEEVGEKSDRKLIKIMQKGKHEMPPIKISNDEATRVISYLLTIAQEKGEKIESDRCDHH